MVQLMYNLIISDYQKILHVKYLRCKNEIAAADFKDYLID